MQRRVFGAGTLLLIVLGSWLLALLGIGLKVLPAAGDHLDDATIGADGPDAPVVVIGVPGLTWEHLSTGSTAGMSGVTGRGGTAALVLRGAHEVTCAEDAWLTIGSGQRAATDRPGCGDYEPAAATGTLNTRDMADEPITADEWQRWQAAADRRALGARPGTLAEVVEAHGSCIAAYGPEAALAAARPDGSIAVYHHRGLTETLVAGETEPPISLPLLTPECQVHLLSAPAVGTGSQPGQLGRIDDAVALLLAELPEETTVILAGLGHTEGRAEATALGITPISSGEATRGRLTSTTTRQADLVQLTDLTPTIVGALGMPIPQEWAGGPAQLAAVDERPWEHARDVAGGVSAAKRWAPTGLVSSAGVLAALLLGAGVLRFSGRPAVQEHVSPPSTYPQNQPRQVRAEMGDSLIRGLTTLGLALPVAFFLVGALPWWSSDQPLLALIVSAFTIAGLLAAVTLSGPWARHPWGPAGVVAAVTAAVLGADAIASARWGLVSVLGLQPVTAGRFYGMGNVGFGLLLGALVVLMAALLAVLGPGRRAAAVTSVVVLGLAATVVNGAPQGGADFGGLPALVAVTGLVALAASGRSWSMGRVVLIGVLAVVAAGAVLVGDWARGPETRTHLGDFVQSILDGEAGGIVTRKLQQSLSILMDYPSAWLVVLALILALLLVTVRLPFLDRAFGRLWRGYQTRAVVTAGLIGALLAWVLNDSGLAAAGACLAVMSLGVVSVLSQPESAASTDAPQSQGRSGS